MLAKVPRWSFFFLSMVLGCFGGLWSDDADQRPPNMVFILLDDLGYGDVQCLNPQRGKIKTPCMDRLAREGMVFTDAHTSSSVCSPSRYSLLTGRYAWRTELQKGVLFGHDTAMIRPEIMTVPGLLKSKGYSTAFIGKWHVGWDWTYIDEKRTQIDFTKPVTNGPSTRGFDYSYGQIASLDIPPYVYVENDKPTAVPDRIVAESKGLAYWRKGDIAPDFKHEEVLTNFVNRGIAYIEKQSKTSQPFFLYLPLPAPHTPILPSQEFKGKSSIGPYGDFVMMVDAEIGRIDKALEMAGIAKDTLLIITSDNGCSKAADIAAMNNAGHYPSAQFRGSKSDIWDGGHRVPFIVRWPKLVTAGSSCHQLICLTDFMATCAEITRTTLPKNAGVDSVSFMSALKGKDSKDRERIGVVHHSINGNFAFRKGPWKLELTPGSGGWSQPMDAQALQHGLPDVQLYNMELDEGETKNLQAEFPEVVDQMKKELKGLIAQGRSNEGPIDKNDVEHIDMWKKGASTKKK